MHTQKPKPPKQHQHKQKTVVLKTIPVNMSQKLPGQMRRYQSPVRIPPPPPPLPVPQPQQEVNNSQTDCHKYN